MMDDLISRLELGRAMYHEAFEKDSDEQRWDGGCWIKYKMFERVVESLPAAQERKKGEWIVHGMEEGNAFPVYTCSECDVLVGINTSNYCPNCGAEMKGEEDDE